jgi:hypothetical protein
MTDARPRVLAPPAPIVAIAGWLVPGSGYWLIGHRARALTIGVTIVLLFATGVLIAGVRVVEAPNLFGPGGGGIAARILQKPWYIGQVLIGPVGIATTWVGHAMGPEARAATSRLGEIGTLYTAVAGMLNLLAIIDSSYRAAMHGRRG